MSYSFVELMILTVVIKLKITENDISNMTSGKSFVLLNIIYQPDVYLRFSQTEKMNMVNGYKHFVADKIVPITVAINN